MDKVTRGVENEHIYRPLATQPTNVDSMYSYESDSALEARYARQHYYGML